MMSLVLFFSFPPPSYSSSVIAAPVTRTVRADSRTVRVPSVPLGSIAGDEIAAYSFTTATYFSECPAYDDSIPTALIPPTVDRQTKESSHPEARKGICYYRQTRFNSTGNISKTKSSGEENSNNGYSSHLEF